MSTSHLHLRAYGLDGLSGWSAPVARPMPGWLSARQGFGGCGMMNLPIIGYGSTLVSGSINANQIAKAYRTDAPPAGVSG